MKNDVIRCEIRKIGSLQAAADALGIGRIGLYYKLLGKNPWKVTELLELSRLCAWTKEQFLNIIEFDGYEKED